MYTDDQAVDASGPAAPGTASDASSAPEKKKRHRSPAYPAIGLDQAVERVRVLWNEDGRVAATLKALQKHWERAGLGGNPTVAVAALGYYGLVESDGSGDSRKHRVSDLAVRILELPSTSPKRAEALAEAALRPKIYAELWEQFEGRLPSSETLRAELVVTRGFNRDSVPLFEKAFRDTISFAKLGEGTPPQEAETGNDPEALATTQPTVAGPPVAVPQAAAQPRPSDGEGVESLHIPLGRPGRVAILCVPRPLSAAEHKYLVGWLELSRDMMLAQVHDEEDEQ